jgi:hypothetical protein
MVIDPETYARRAVQLKRYQQVCSEQGRRIQRLEELLSNYSEANLTLAFRVKWLENELSCLHKQ